jgi:hypothetical protein
MNRGRVHAIVVVLMTCAVVSLGASPAVAAPRVFQGWTTLQNSARVSGDSLEVESAQGTLVLLPEVAPPSQRAWLLSDDPGLEVEGQFVRGQLFIDRVIAYFYPATADARGVPGVVTVMVVPENEPCGSGRGSPATAHITYDGETLSAAARTACQRARGLQEFTFTMHADKSTHAL